MKAEYMTDKNTGCYEKLHEECAVFGISLSENDKLPADEAAGITYNGLLAMQHRGQEGAGIAVLHGSSIICSKNTGLVSEVFNRRNMNKLPDSFMAIGHTRYSTTGSNIIENVQPFVTEFLTGRIASAHNGNIINSKELRKNLESFGLDFEATSDSEVISSLVAYKTLITGSIIKGVTEAASELVGAFSLIILSSDRKLIALRDPGGFRPLCIGENENGIVIASESCALDSCGFTFLRDVEPGEVVVIENGKLIHTEIYKRNQGSSLCIFEYVYFARPDSVIDGLSVYEARYNMGRILAREHPVDADAVCGVPDSGLEAAMGYSAESGLPLVSGFVKNRYIGRSFIFPTQVQRENAVKLKLNPLKINIDGKRIILVDDSIVRGTTSAKIVGSLRHAGAAKVHMRISSPPFLHTCHFGTDIDSEENLIANKISIDEIREKIGADSLGYISLQGLVSACKKSHVSFCTGCFNGNYGIDTSIGKAYSDYKKNKKSL